MAKQLNVNLSMTANTSAAVAQLKQLQQQLTNLMNSTTNVNNSSFGITKEIQEATEAAAQLKVQLQAATDSTTGKLDLSKFNQELHKSGMTLEQYQDKLSALGPEGEKTFAQVTESIVNADAKIRDANSVLAQFATTLKNAARWQISSSILHGFMGSLQSAYGYAKDLNSSLNDIQIVTGNSTEKMAAFAEQANKAAKSLSTTTTTYTDAALIFYQQGLDDEAVLDRTNTVIKLANVTKDSAEDVSSYMTAIWENFYDGSKSLEYYADVITRLGADTAASSAEIAEGLESFASIGDTIGLSYEYATSALTTIVAKTRASASEVGNGLRTIFSRLQNLSLGETLEDGTDLTKYTKALATVGVNIKDASGELKSMDDILDDLASKWDTLGQAEKTALANTVGGVRQYTKLIALMDNWDFMKQNIQRAKSSEGSLQEQADIYAESWEASRKRVKAALEDIYATLIDDKFFIKLNNGFADFLGLISKTVKGLGGLQGVLINLGAIIAKVYQKDIAKSMSNFGLSIMSMTKTGRKKIEELRTNAIEQSSKQAVDDGSISGMAMSNSLSARGKALQSFYDASKDLSQVDKEIAQNLLDEQKALTDNVAKRAEELKIAQQTADETEREFLVTQGNKKGAINYYNTTAKEEARQTGTKDFLKDTLGKEISDFETLIGKNKSASIVKDLSSKINASLKEMQKGFSKLGITMEEALGEKGAKSFQTLLDCFDENGQILEGQMNKFRKAWSEIIADTDAEGVSSYTKVLDKLAQKISGLPKERFKEIAEAIKTTGDTSKFSKKEIEAYNNALRQAEEIMSDNRALGGRIAQTAQSQSFLSNATEAFTEKMSQMRKSNISGADAFGMLGNAAMSTTAAIQNVINVTKNWSDMDIGSKVTSVTTTVLTVVSAISQVGLVLANSKTILAAIGESITTVIGALAAAAPYIIVIGAIIGAIVLTLKNLYDMSPEGQLKKVEKELNKTKEQTQQFKEELSATKQEAESLKSTFDSYDSIVDKLNNCTKGTTEWKNALIEVNNKVLEMMSQYPELASMIKDGENAIYQDENGIYQIRDWAKDEMTSKKDNEQIQKQAQVFASQNRENNLQVEKSQKELVLKMSKSNTGLTGTDSEGQANNDYIESQDIAKWIIENRKIFEQATSQKEVQNKLSDYFDREGFIYSSKALENWANTIIECQGDFVSLDNAIQSNIQAQKTQNEVLISQHLSKNEMVQQSQYKDQILNASENSYQTAYDSEFQKWTNGKIANSVGIGTSFGKELFEAFKNTEEGQKYKDIKATNYKKDGSIEFSYTGENGTTETDSLTQQQLAEIIASSQALEKVSQNANQLAISFQNLNNGTDKDKAIANFISDRNLDNVSYGTFSELKVSRNDDKKLRESFGINNKSEEENDKTAMLYGFNSAKEMLNSFKEGIDNATQAWEDVGVLSDNTILDSKITDKLFLQTFKNLKETFNDLNLGSLGEQGGNQFLQGLNKVVNQANPDQYENITKIFATTDWSNWDALDNVISSLKELGIEIDTQDSFWINFQNNIRLAAGALQDFSEQKKAFNEILKMDSATAGTEISKDQFDALNNIFGDISDKVIQIDENTWKLTEDLGNLNSIDFSNLYSKMNSLSEIQQNLSNQKSLINDVYTLSTSEDLNGLQESLQNLMNGQESAPVLEQLGYTKKRLDELVSSGTKEELNALGQQIQAFLKQDYDTSGLQEQLAARAKDFDELQDLLDKGAIKIDTFNKAWKLMRNQLDEDIDADRVEKLTDQIMELATQSDDLADSLAEDERTSKKVASSIERYSSAVEDVTENYDSWAKALKQIDKSGSVLLDPDTLEDVGNAMADMLDIDASSLSKGFISDIENLNLMKKAAEGDTQAYEDLRKAAAEDILAHCEIENQEEFDEALTNLNTKIADMNLEDIEVGADLSGVDGFLDACNELVNAAGMTAKQATDYLSSMGVDAQVEEIDNPTEDVQEHVGTSVTPTQIKGTIPTIAGIVNAGNHLFPTNAASQQVEFTEWDVQPQKTTTTAEKNTKATTLKVTSAHKSSGGNFKKTQSKATSPSAGNKKGGSGGGGSTKAPTKNSEKHITKAKEEDRYHVIKNQIEDLSAQYDRIGKAKDKAFGPNRIKLLDQEIAKQKELTAANKKYLEEVEQYQELDKGKMVGYGAIFDKNGTITNYNELLEEQVRLYNEAVDKFNEAYTDDEGAKAAFEAAKERYEQFKEDLDKYEESQDLYKDQLQAIIDAENQERALRLEKTQAEVELKVNVSEDSIEYLDYALNNIENKAYDVANAFALLDKKTATYFEKSKAYVDGLKSLFANQGLTDDDFNKLLAGDVSAFEKIKSMLSNGENAGFTSDDIEAIRDYVKELISTNEELQEVRQTVHDQLLTVWDEWNDKMDTAISKIEHLQNITSSYKNIIDIVGQKSLGLTDSFMSDLSQKTIDQANNKLQAEKARYDSLKQSRDEAFAKYENQKNSGILSEEEVKMWEDNLKQMDDDVQSAAESFQSAWEDALNAANEEFENSVQRIIDAYSDAAAGLMGSMSELQEAFDRGTDLSDQYLDDYEKIYQFSKLNRDIQESIDSTDSVKAKKELLALQSKINAYEESGVEISEYQMDYLRKEYELKKAQIDLEESQNAKSQVKMQRDNEGNYSYVYTANDDDVAKAEQNYEDKLHEMQVANADYIKELQGNMVQMEQDYQDKVQEIMTDTSLTAEERMVKLNEVNEYYDEKMKYYISEAQVWQDNSSRLYDQDWKNYSEMTGYKISAADQWIDKWKETQLAMLTGFSSLEEYQQNHDTNVANLLLSAGSAFSTWQTNIETAMNSAGTSIGTFGDDATETLKAISEASKETKDSVVDMAESAEEAINGVTEAITNWEDAYSKVLKETLAGNEQLINSFNELLRAWSGVSSLPDTTPESKKVSTQSAPTPKTSSFDTGGYTGSWGADGKFALLHEKELILNAEDTKNFLTAIDTVRQISEMIDLNALSSSGGLTSLFAAKASTSDRTLQQEVTIHAEFPNVEDKDQISAAFNDLVNLASQYANRK